jgi:hypothetical protein
MTAAGCRTQPHSSSPHISLWRRRRPVTTEGDGRTFYSQPLSIRSRNIYWQTQHRNLGAQQFAYDWRCERQPQTCALANPFLSRSSCDKQTNKHILTLQFARDFCDREFPRKWILEVGPHLATSHHMTSSSGVPPLATTSPGAAPVALRNVCTELDADATSAGRLPIVWTVRYR